MRTLLSLSVLLFVNTANANDLAIVRSGAVQIPIQQVDHGLDHYQRYQGWQATPIVLDNFDTFNNRLCLINGDEVDCITSVTRRWQVEYIAGMAVLAIGENFIGALDIVGNLWLEIAGHWNMISAGNYSMIDASRNHVCAVTYDGVESYIECQWVGIHYGIPSLSVMGEIVGLAVNNNGFYWIADDGTVDGHSHYPAPGDLGEVTDLLGNAVQIAAVGSSVCVLNTSGAIDCAGWLSGYYPGPFNRFAMNSNGVTDVLLLEDVGGGLRTIQATTF